MLRTSIIIAAMALSLVGTGALAKSCKDPATGKFIKCPPPAAAAPQCKTGKPCGKTCIAKDKVCHFPT